MTTDADGPLIYYKLTLWAFGSGELKRARKASSPSPPIKTIYNKFILGYTEIEKREGRWGKIFLCDL